MLHRLLSSDPAFFVDVLSKVYRAKSDNEEAEHRRTRLASRQTDIVCSHRGIWFRASKKTATWWVRCSKDGLTKRSSGSNRSTAEKLAKSTLVTFSPGRHRIRVRFGRRLWCEICLKQLQNHRIEEGLITEVLNKRGVTTRSLESGGEQERDLVSKYRKEADQLADVWPRSAESFAPSRATMSMTLVARRRRAIPPGPPIVAADCGAELDRGRCPRPCSSQSRPPI